MICILYSRSSFHQHLAHLLACSLARVLFASCFGSLRVSPPSALSCMLRLVSRSLSVRHLPSPRALLAAPRRVPHNTSYNIQRAHFSVVATTRVAPRALTGLRAVGAIATPLAVAGWVAWHQRAYAEAVPLHAEPPALHHIALEYRTDIADELQDAVTEHEHHTTEPEHEQSLWSMISHCLWDNAALIATSIIAAVLSSAAGLAIPSAMGSMIDMIGRASSLADLINPSLAILGLGVAHGSLTFVYQSMLSKAIERFTSTLRKSIFGSMVRKDIVRISTLVSCTV
jgi:hypothetical protein